ncbi:hypothetical protein LOTGIDRAFT_146358, partial [Lottia gigantea]
MFNVNTTDIKRNTINVELYQGLKIVDIIDEIEDIVGENSVIAACPTTGNVEITFDNHERLKHLLNKPIVVHDKVLSYNLIGSKIMVVSFMNIPCYIPDNEILTKLAQWNVKPLGNIRHRTIRYKDRNIPDGTRFIKCEFPPEVTSLPYATFFDGRSFTIKHNNQQKVCFECFKPGHDIKDCPVTICRRCKQSGHIKKFCIEEICDDCTEFNYKCLCKTE